MAIFNFKSYNLPFKCGCGQTITLVNVSYSNSITYRCACETCTTVQLQYDTMLVRVVQVRYGLLLKTYDISFDDIENGVLEMPKATLSYESLGTNPDGSLAEGAYKLKLKGNFKQDIEPVVIFIKASIPSSDRTYDPTTFEWFFHEKYHPLMEQALKGSRFSVSYGVTKETFQELKRIQDEYAKQAGQSFQTQQHPAERDLETFQELIVDSMSDSDLRIHVPIFDVVKSWSRSEAEKAYKRAIRFFHPDLHPERASEASSLNEVWSRLKESYYK